MEISIGSPQIAEAAPAAKNFCGLRGCDNRAPIRTNRDKADGDTSSVPFRTGYPLLAFRSHRESSVCIHCGTADLCSNLDTRPVRMGQKGLFLRLSRPLRTGGYLRVGSPILNVRHRAHSRGPRMNYPPSAVRSSQICRSHLPFVPSDYLAFAIVPSNALPRRVCHLR